MLKDVVLLLPYGALKVEKEAVEDDNVDELDCETVTVAKGLL